jgi:hypothetical protein
MADIKINASEWNALSTEQQTEITAILRRAGSIGDGDKIVPDAAAPEIGLAAADAIQPEGFWCKLACNGAEAAAVAACAALSGPAAAVCVAAAHAAGEYCRSKC